MNRTRIAPAALLAAFCGFALSSIIQPGWATDHAPVFDVAMYADDGADELLVVIRREDGRGSGLEGTGGDARVLEPGELGPVLRRIRNMRRADGVSLVSIDADGAGSESVRIVADGEKGESAFIQIGGDGLFIHAQDGEESFHMSFGGGKARVDGTGDDRNRRGPAIDIHAHDGAGDDDRAVVLLRHLDADAVRDFVNDIDDVSRATRREVLRQLGL